MSVDVIYQAMTRVCEGRQPAWQNLDLLGNSCHVDTWLMLMTSAIVADSKQQVNHKNRFDNDSGTFNQCVCKHTYSHHFQVNCLHCSKAWVRMIVKTYWETNTGVNKYPLFRLENAVARGTMQEHILKSGGGGGERTFKSEKQFLEMYKKFKQHRRITPYVEYYM